MSLLAVLLPLNVPKSYSYRSDAPLKRGSFVRVPLGNSEKIGVVWGEAERSSLPESKIKTIIEVLPLPPLPEKLCELVDRVAGYSMAPLGMVLRLVLNTPDALKAEKPIIAYRFLAVPEGVRITEARERVVKAVSAEPLVVKDIVERAGVSRAVVRGMVKAGVLEEVRLGGLAPKPFKIFPKPKKLSPAQREAAGVLCEAVSSSRFAPFLLDGVTGSGKTEVYFEAVERALKEGKNVLILLPEIALAAQFPKRIAERFGVEVALWHSSVSAAKRRELWKAALRGELRLLVGARSALFLPFASLGLIIVDEEHEGAFKQEEGVLYHARDMAVLAASLYEAAIILASATPSLETLANVKAGRYREVCLPHRHAGAKLPAMEAIDMREHPPVKGAWLAPPLVEALAGNLEEGKQSLLFLNRRGFAPLTLCSKCGHHYACSECDAWLVQHKYKPHLHCHHCGFQKPLPIACENCGEKESLVACGPGVERIEGEIAGLFPDSRRLILSSDHMRSPAALALALEQIDKGEVDIIVGTQIIAKGHHFPKLTLVGVVDADLSLSNGDLRAGERSFQLLHQVAGRAGRIAAQGGRALLQTHMPEHPIIQALLSSSREAFLSYEEGARRNSHMPPFSRLVALILSGEDPNALAVYARKLAACAPLMEGLSVLGPAPAPLARVRGRYRMRFLCKAPKSFPVQRVIGEWVGKTPPPAKIKLQIDVDPHNFL